MSSKILIVEDAAETLSLLDAIFTEQGFGTLHAGNGRQALEIVQKEKPDLIISDILMPEMDGFVFFKELKKMEGVSHIPFFILTVRGRMEDTFRVLGVDEFFVKPFDSQLLLDKVKSRIRGGIVVDKAPTIKPQNTEAPPAQRVLVISDSAEIILKIGKVLKHLRCEIAIVAKEALALGKFRDWNPDFIILEVLMGGKSANNIISRVRQTPNGKTTPIILFSNTDKEALKNISIHQKASHIESARKACLEAGATDSIGGFEETAFLTFIKNQLTIS